ncbi:hypothetical protein Pmani_010293 [Petrolisthes manimaculis]|uniref:Carbohydrate sulfotransferase n=1 Tax=Petrolisthes manimaculis TaxID=1843537 RepID=A0AAE1Q2A8_9EUCA|nr:hypothetical protein Pmani_010293 [Petrolisthes manimaculis]
MSHRIFGMSRNQVFIAAIGFYIVFALTTDILVPPDPKKDVFKLNKLPLRASEEIQIAEYEQRRSQVKDVCSMWGAYSNRGKFLRSAQRNAPEDRMKNMVLKDRKDLSQSQLERLWQLNKKSIFHQMFVDERHGLTWCKVPKAASTSWLYAFLQVAGIEENMYKDKVGRHSLLREEYPLLPVPVLRNIMPKTLKFMVVRHPFERVLSAYRDKLENYERDLKARGGYYYSIYGKRIVKVYRREEGGEKEPTFREFVQYLLDTDVEEYDEHWRPISLLCTPCHVRYDVIAKMETLGRDSDFILYHRGLAGVTHIEWSHRTSSSDHSTSDLATSYFNKLTPSEIKRLYHKYLMDFLMFEYEVKPYLKLVNATENNSPVQGLDQENTRDEYDEEYNEEEEEDYDDEEEEDEQDEDTTVNQDDVPNMIQTAELISPVNGEK